MRSVLRLSSMTPRADSRMRGCIKTIVVNSYSLVLPLRSLRPVRLPPAGALAFIAEFHISTTGRPLPRRTSQAPSQRTNTFLPVDLASIYTVYAKLGEVYLTTAEAMRAGTGRGTRRISSIGGGETRLPLSQRGRFGHHP